jgi:hypothetical protein
VFSGVLDILPTSIKRGIGLEYSFYQLGGFQFQVLANGVFVFPGKILGGLEYFQKQIVGGFVNGEVIVSGHKMSPSKGDRLVALGGRMSQRAEESKSRISS